MANVGGEYSVQDQSDAIDIAKKALGPDATPEQIKVAADTALNEIRTKNQTPAAGYNILSSAAKTAVPLGRGVMSFLDPGAGAVEGLANKGIDYVNPKNNSFVGSLLNAIPFDQNPYQEAEAQQKQLIADKVKAAMNPDAVVANESPYIAP